MTTLINPTPLEASTEEWLTAHEELLAGIAKRDPDLAHLVQPLVDHVATMRATQSRLMGEREAA